MLDMEKLEQLQNNDAFLAALDEAQTPEQLQKVLEDNGLALTVEQICQLLTEEEAEGELTVEQLDNVAGGGFFSWLGKRFKKRWKKESKKYKNFLDNL